MHYFSDNLFSKMTVGNALTGDLPEEFGNLSDTLQVCTLGKIRMVGLLSCLILEVIDSHHLLFLNLCGFFQRIKLVENWATLSGSKESVRACWIVQNISLMQSMIPPMEVIGNVQTIGDLLRQLLSVI
jgi:hypothetical protein